MATLAEMIPPVRVQVTVGGETFSVRPLNLRHLARLEQEAGVRLQDLQSKGLSFVLHVLTVLLDDAGHLGLPDGTTWAQKLDLVGNLVQFGELEQVSKAVTAGLPHGPNFPAP